MRYVLVPLIHNQHRQIRYLLFGNDHRAVLQEAILCVGLSEWKGFGVRMEEGEHRALGFSMERTGKVRRCQRHGLP